MWNQQQPGGPGGDGFGAAGSGGGDDGGALHRFFFPGDPQGYLLLAEVARLVGMTVKVSRLFLSPILLLSL